MTAGRPDINSCLRMNWAYAMDVSTGVGTVKFPSRTVFCGVIYEI